MKCARNKATAIILDLARMNQNSLSERLKSAPFTVSTDGSNDATSKQYPLVVRTKDTETGLVHSELLSIPVCSEATTGQNIFNLIDKDLSDRNVTRDNCLSLGSDNASVMTGRHKGVYAYVKEKQPSVFLSGCVLGVKHISAKKAAEALPSIDDVLIDIYFDKSDSRKLLFKGSQDVCDLEQKRMLKHVCTRWLSIGRCIERLLLNWEFMLGILCIPHSSAHCERVFSVVRKNRTDQRATLGDKTLEALVVIKSRRGHPCDLNRKHSNETLDRLKSSYYNHLNE